MSITLDQFIAAVESRGPSLRDDDLRQFESEIGCRLPDDYREFLLRCNGGFVEADLWFLGPNPAGYSVEAGVHHVGGLRSDDESYSLRWARECYQGARPRIPLELLWIMDDPCGNAVCLGVKSAARGKIYFWDHELESAEWDSALDSAPHLTLLAESFTEFIRGLEEDPD